MRFFLVILCLLFASEAQSAYVLKNHASCSGTGGNSCTTGAVDMSGVDLLVTCLAYYNGTTTSAPSDSSSNSYTDVYNTANAGGNLSGRLSYKQAPAVTNSMTFTATNNGTYPAFFVAGFSGSAATPLDQQNEGTTGAGATSPQAAGSITPTQNNALVMTCGAFAASSSTQPNTITVDSGFTTTDSPINGDSANHEAGGFAYKIQTTAILVNPTWSWAGVGNGIAEVASFTAASAVVTPLPQPFMQLCPGGSSMCRKIGP